MADGLEKLSPGVRAFLERVNRDFGEPPAAGSRVPRKPQQPTQPGRVAIKQP